MEYTEIQSLLQTIRYKNFTFRLTKCLDPDFMLLHVEFSALDPLTGKFGNVRGLDHIVTALQKRDTILDVAFAAVKNAEEHEMMENFIVGGVKVKDPHKYNEPSTDVGTVKTEQEMYISAEVALPSDIEKGWSLNEQQKLRALEFIKDTNIRDVTISFTRQHNFRMNVVMSAKTYIGKEITEISINFSDINDMR